MSDADLAEIQAADDLTHEAPIPCEPAVTATPEPASLTRRRRRIWPALLGLALILSLATNGVILYALFQIRTAVDEVRGDALTVVSGARADINALTDDPVFIQVKIDEQIPISETIGFSQTFSIPFNTVFPFSTRINAVIQLPLLGPQNVSFPINATIPVSMSFRFPVQAEIPISLTYHADLEFPIEITLPNEILAPIDQALLDVEDSLR
ncbi:MAG: hypothetical protein JXB35_05855 [Anaerolineae bacterium]|nr:hypothetical protein [Anaerolineae bacterium]